MIGMVELPDATASPVALGGLVRLMQPDVHVSDGEADSDAPCPEMAGVPHPPQRMCLRAACRTCHMRCASVPQVVLRMLKCTVRVHKAGAGLSADKKATQRYAICKWTG